MEDSYSNIVFIIIAAVVFLGRAFLNNMKKKEQEKEEEPPVRRQAPVRFDDDISMQGGHWSKSPEPAKRIPKQPPNRPKQKPLTDSLKTTDFSFKGKTNFSDPPSPAADSSSRVLPKAPLQGAERKDLTEVLKNLSPLKQAVVMAEILGPPKGLN